MENKNWKNNNFLKIIKKVFFSISQNMVFTYLKYHGKHDFWASHKILSRFKKNQKLKKYISMKNHENHWFSQCLFSNSGPEGFDQHKVDGFALGNWVAKKLFYSQTSKWEVTPSNIITVMIFELSRKCRVGKTITHTKK